MMFQELTVPHDGALSFSLRDGSQRPWWWYLDLHGRPLYFLSGACGTCEAIFERVDTLDTPLTPHQFSTLLNTGLAAVTPHVIQTVIPLLPKGQYIVSLLSLLPTRRDKSQALPRIGCAADYFWWRLFQQRGLDIMYELVLPCVVESALDPTRIGYYREQILQGCHPTALALSFDDERSPAGRCSQSALVHMLLDGHHKVMAASQLGRPIQVLSFLRETAFTDIPMRSEQTRRYYEDQNQLPRLAFS